MSPPDQSPPVPDAERPRAATRGATAGNVSRRSVSGRFLLLVVLISAVAAAAKLTYRWWHGYRTEQYRDACQAAVEEQSWAPLKSASSQWLEWDDTSDDARMFLAEACVQLSDLEHAVNALGDVADSYDGALEALALRSDFLFGELNRPYEAVETWQRMLRINPRADLARERLIYFYAMTLQRGPMMQHILRAMELHCEPPEAYAYLLLAHEVTFSDGLRMTKLWLESYPDDVALNVAHALYLARFSPENTVNIYGMSLIVAGDETLVNECLERYPSDLEVLAYHIDKAIIVGDAHRVLELLGQSPPEAEQDTRFWRYRGWYLASQDRFAEAEEALNRALDLHPFNWRSRLILAGVLRQLDRPAEATEQAHIADVGKELQRELFQLPNARALNPTITRQIDEYLRLTAPPIVLSAWEHRME